MKQQSCGPFIKSAAVALMSVVGSAQAADLEELRFALSGGTPALEVRPRYEFVNTDANLKDANAFTVRTRLGYTTGGWNGFDIGLSLENISDLSDDAYNSGTLINNGNGKAEYATVLDPEGTAVTDAYIRYNAPFLSGLQLKLGRQHFVLDNARWFGDAGWRQKEITYDGLVTTYSGIPKTTFTYAFLTRSKFFTFTDIPMHSQVYNLSWKPLAQLNLAAYYYQLDFVGSFFPATPANRLDTQTAGLRATGTQALDGASLMYALEGAWQSDFGTTPDSVKGRYWLAELGAKVKDVTAKLGYELRGSNKNPVDLYAVQTPFATGHAFGGWSDVLINAPSSGVEDFYASVSYAFKGYTTTLIGHDLRADYDQTANGAHYGYEINAMVAKPINKNLTALVKYAEFNAHDFKTTPDTEKFWVQATYSF